MKFTLQILSILIVVLMMQLSCRPKVKLERTLIQNVLLVDGTGSAARVTSVRISGDKIDEIGPLNPTKKDIIVDGTDLVLSPGFVDSHSHHDWDTLATVESAISQGITTIIVGQDGFMQYPLGAYFDSIGQYPRSVNVASYTGHNRIRREVMGTDFKRTASPDEVQSMMKIVAAEMENGALGLSSGLEYDPGIYSTTAEVIALAKVASSYGGRYISHMRNEDPQIIRSIREIIAIGKEADIPVQISHFKLIGQSIWGESARYLAVLDSARNEGIDITADIYPYEYWQSTMTVLFPDRDFNNRKTAEYALTELTRPEWMIIAQFNAEPAYEGKTLLDISLERNEDPVTTYINLIAMSQAVPGEKIICKSMIDTDILSLLAWPHANVGSDGSPYSHPRGWGAFPKYFSMAGDVPIEERIRKMTSLSAKHVGLPFLGIVEPGAPADLVLFDPNKLKDKATFSNSSQRSEGIVTVWVNGTIVYENNAVTGARPGKVYKRMSLGH